MAHQDTVFWIGGIVLLVVLLANIGIFPQFAIVTKTTCIDNTISEWEFDGNSLDTKGLNHGTNHGGNFTTGKFGQALMFDGTNESYIDLPTILGDRIMWIKNNEDYDFYANINGTNYVNTIQSSEQTPLIGPGFGKNKAMTVDRIAVFSSLSVTTMNDLYANSSGADVCYQTQEEVNVTCFDYASSQISDNQTASLEVSGDFYPACNFTWKNPQYEIKNNQCEKSFFYESSCLESENCYLTNQACIEDLDYECYVLQNNICFKKLDYNSCIVENNYDTLTSCQEDIITTNAIVSEPSLKDKLNDEVFEVGGFSVTLIQLIILLIIIVSLLYVTNKK